MFLGNMKKCKTLLILLLVSGVVIVLGLSSMMGVMAYRRQKQTFLFQQGEEAYNKGDLELAKIKLKAYTRRDPSHEQSWLYLADIYERQLLWRDAAMVWKRLVNLNVLNNDYVKHHIYANYRAHDFGALDKIFSNISLEKQREYFEIYALTQFFQHTNTDATDRLVAMLPKNGMAAQMVRAIKNQGPISELEKLENCNDAVIQVETLMQDAFMSEYRTKDLKRAEECLRKAASINPDLCRAPLGDFLFRNARHKDAYEIYKTVRPQMMTVGNIINYAEVLFLSKDTKALSDLENEVHHKRRSAILLRAYIQSLQAYLGKDSQAMIKNYRVAQIHRSTPVGLLLSYAVAVEDSDIALMVSVLSHWRKTKLFKDRQAEILANVRKMLASALEDDKLEDAARLAQMFLSQKPPELLCWQIVVLDQMKRGTLNENLLQQAFKLFPKESFFQAQRLRLAFAKGDRQGILDIYDQLIAASDTPTRERYRKVLYLERQMLLDKAFQELLTMMKEDNSLVSAKHCLGFGIRTGNKAALNAAAAFPELAEIAQFEMERRYGDIDKATKMLTSNQLEKGLSADKPEDCEILLPLAIYLALSKELERAKAIYLTLLPHSENNAIIDLNLSEIFAQQGDLLKALEYAANAYKKNPKSPIVQTVYGIRHYAMNNYEQAAALIPNSVPGETEKAILVECLEKIIEASYKEDDTATCRKTIRRLQALQPDNKCAKEYLVKIGEYNQQ